MSIIHYDKYGKPRGEDADKVDGIHAATTPTANKLLAMNATPRFPSHAVSSPLTVHKEGGTNSDGEIHVVNHSGTGAQAAYSYYQSNLVDGVRVGWNAVSGYALLETLYTNLDLWLKAHGSGAIRLKNPTHIDGDLHLTGVSDKIVQLQAGGATGEWFDVFLDGGDRKWRFQDNGGIYFWNGSDWIEKVAP